MQKEEKQIACGKFFRKIGNLPKTFQRANLRALIRESFLTLEDLL